MKRVHVKSFGCSANLGEGEVIQGLLTQANYTLSSEEDADVIVINVCTVKGNTGTLREIRKNVQQYPRAQLVITGCVTPDLVPLVHALAPSASIVSTHALRKIPEVVTATLNGKHIVDRQRCTDMKLGLPRVRLNPVIGIVPISSGCLDACTYCSTKLVKGHLKSYPAHEIVRECKSLLEDGCKELWITAQDTACYGFDNNTHLAQLLGKILALPGDFRVRVGMGNPWHVLKYLDAFAQTLNHAKMFRFVHLPVQSGNDTILAHMKRKHTVKDFERVVTVLRTACPDLSLSTDIICGFPGESDAQFHDSVNLIKRIRPTVLNISRFVARPKTRAALYKDQVDPRIIKSRSRHMTDVFKRIACVDTKKWNGWSGRVLIDEYGSEPGTVVGRTDAYRPVVLKKKVSLGQCEHVTIKHTTEHILYA